MRWIVVLLMLGVIFTPVIGQGCGNGVPCKPVVWPLPSWPNLQSPTPSNWEGYSGNPGPTSTPLPTATPYSTPTPAATYTPFFDSSEMGQAVSTIQALNNATAQTVRNFQGTPVAKETLVAQLSTSQFIGYVRGIDTSIAGPFTPMLNVFIIGFLLVLTVKLIQFLLPLLLAIFGFIRKMVNTVLDFIPL